MSSAGARGGTDTSEGVALTKRPMSCEDGMAPRGGKADCLPFVREGAEFAAMAGGGALTIVMMAMGMGRWRKASEEE
jgi:hypothetical protein